MSLNFVFVFVAWIIIEAILSHTSFAQNIQESELWINTTYQAEDVGIRCGKLPQCKAWNSWWKLQIGDITPTTEIIDLLSSRKVKVSLNSIVQLTAFGLPKYLLSKYKIVHINFKKVCGNYSRYLLIDSISAAKKRGINLSEICNNYETKKKEFLGVEDGRNIYSYFSNSTEISREPDILELEMNKPNGLLTEKKNQDDLQRIKRSLLIQSEGIHIINPRAKITYQISANFMQLASMIIVRNQRVADFYELGEMTSILEFHKGLQIDLERVCAPKEFNTKNITINKATKFLQNWNEMESNNEKIENNGYSREKINNLTMFFKRGIELSNILSIFDSEIMSNMVPLSSSLLMTILNESNYDSRSPPIIHKGKITEVFFGILIQSMSNFDQNTMDYDMDMWLRMAWHDQRLAHQFDRPILVNDENFLKKIWRPAPFFQNAKEAEYHRMITLNFWLYIFPNGEIFFETHIYLKPSCKLILCKYPHDNQVCSLKITASQNSIRYIWFPRLSDAIRMNKLMESELYVEKCYKRYCNGVRKTGNFSCLEASCLLKRNLGYHMTRTYVPTATCVVFSWISVWLPEEFVTGRIFGSLTLFLTLSAESSAVKEMLPKVSYMKAIDLWFGFTASFVFITMLEALIVISLEHKSRRLRKKAESGVDDMSRYQMMLLMLESGRYHSTARNIDRYCRTLYPVVFLLFLLIYYFVIIEGDETKCLRRTNDEL